MSKESGLVLSNVNNRSKLSVPEAVNHFVRVGETTFGPSAELRDVRLYCFRLGMRHGYVSVRVSSFLILERFLKAWGWP